MLLTAVPRCLPYPPFKLYSCLDCPTTQFVTQVIHLHSTLLPQVFQNIEWVACCGVLQGQTNVVLTANLNVCNHKPNSQSTVNWGVVPLCIPLMRVCLEKWSNNSIRWFGFLSSHINFLDARVWRKQSVSSLQLNPLKIKINTTPRLHQGLHSAEN